MTQPQIHPERQARVHKALKMFSIAAFVTGTWLLLLVAEMVYKYLILPSPSDAPGWFFYVAQAHGVFYMLYLISTVNLGINARWEPLKWITTALAGTIPFLSFAAEYKRRKEVTAAYQL